MCRLWHYKTTIEFSWHLIFSRSKIQEFRSTQHPSYHSADESPMASDQHVTTKWCCISGQFVFHILEISMFKFHHRVLLSTGNISPTISTGYVREILSTGVRFQSKFQERKFSNSSPPFLGDAVSLYNVKNSWHYRRIYFVTWALT